MVTTTDPRPTANLKWPSMQEPQHTLTKTHHRISAQLQTGEETQTASRELKMERRERMDQLARDEMSQWPDGPVQMRKLLDGTVASYGVEFDPANKKFAVESGF
ncbi:unnamed protein product [Danaus chrysippus]|uniref:(African queen) hypothetical protein n=1 Tax=Danaus chrysippus TaxID=151541 RepID=A0A8J2QP72_9NEOP|nr:unnamed protein product [Danaus chrysippus]